MMIGGAAGGCKLIAKGAILLPIHLLAAGAIGLRVGAEPEDNIRWRIAPHDRHGKVERYCLAGLRRMGRAAPNDQQREDQQHAKCCQARRQPPAGGCIEQTVSQTVHGGRFAHFLPRDSHLFNERSAKKVYLWLSPFQS